jgi:hypothetical protein
MMKKYNVVTHKIMMSVKNYLGSVMMNVMLKLIMINNMRTEIIS